jgi:hypothetical protein
MTKDKTNKFVTKIEEVTSEAAQIIAREAQKGWQERDERLAKAAPGGF